MPPHNPYPFVGLAFPVTLAGVSYNITVESTAGEHTVTVSGDVPEGKHVISGHLDGSNSSLAVSRVHPDGRFLASASSSHVKEK